MALNKKILQKISEKTVDNIQLRDFIVNVLQGENRGVGWINKFYLLELHKAMGDNNENRED